MAICPIHAFQWVKRHISETTGTIFSIKCSMEFLDQNASSVCLFAHISFSLAQIFADAELLQLLTYG